MQPCPCGIAEHDGSEPYAYCSECENTGAITEGEHDDIVEKECLCIIEAKQDTEANA